jgi:hypothetical protein
MTPRICYRCINILFTGPFASRQFSTHIWSTCSRISGLQNRYFPRMFGQHLRMNGLSDAHIMLIPQRMRFPLYICMNTLYGQPVVAAHFVENGLAGHR